MYYVSPIDAPLFKPGGRMGYYLSMWAGALPFIGIGLWLTVRRLIDARLSGWLLLLFFVPFANLIFFLACASVPGRQPPSEKAGSHSEEHCRAFGAATLMAGVAGAVVSLGAGAMAIGLLGSYGAGLFIGAPTLAGFVSTMVFMRLHPPSLLGVSVATMGGCALSFGVMTLFALEGLICLMMAAPLALGAAFIGSAVAYVFVRCAGAELAQTTVLPSLTLLPLLIVGEHLMPVADTPIMPVETVVVVNAPPQVVWRHVVAFDPLPPAEHWLFRAGVAAPLGARIEGEGVGAVRHCRFTTGAFVEPITVWRPGRELSFGVTAQPDPLEELTLFPGPRPPHLDGYLDVRRGQFLLERLAGDRTRLVGRTWYRARMFPQAYWRWWADRVIHLIHQRVLTNVASRAVRDRRRSNPGSGRAR